MYGKKDKFKVLRFYIREIKKGQVITRPFLSLYNPFDYFLGSAFF